MGLFGFGKKKKIETIEAVKPSPEPTDAEEQFYYAKTFLKNSPPDHEKAYIWFQKAAKQGHHEAQVQCGLWCCSDLNPNKNYYDAINWFADAASEGYAKAQYYYTLLHAQGHGDPVDNAFILGCYKEASAGGSAPASYECGLMYYHGKGSPASKSVAEAYFQKAAQQAKHDFVHKIADLDLITTINSGNLAEAFLKEHF